MHYHFCGLGPRDVEFEVGILLPVAEQKGKLEEESVVGIAQGGESLRARIPVQAALLRLAGTDELLPQLEIVVIGGLDKDTLRLGPGGEGPADAAERNNDNKVTRRSRVRTTSLLSFLISAFSSSAVPN